MAYRLDSIQAPGEALRRVAAEQLDEALAALAPGPAGVTAAGVHTARKSLKKTRSLVRLARPALGEAAYRHAGASLRDAGRLLSGARDAHVMAASMAELAERYVGQVPAETFETLQRDLAARADDVPAGDEQTSEQAAAAPTAAAAATAAIAAIRAEVDDWPLHDVRRRTLVSGLERSYRRGRAGLEAVRDDPADSEASHDWRKRVKDLWYQQRLIAPAWPAVLGTHAEEAHVLSEHLGQDHDFAVLRDHLRSADIDQPVDVAGVLELVERHREELGRLALRLGARVYAEPPRAFTQRIDGYLRAWRSEERSAEPTAL